MAASGTEGMKVTVTELVDGFTPPLNEYFVSVLRKLGYRVTLRRLPDTERNRECFETLGAASRSSPADSIADFPLPSNFYEILACGAKVGYPFGYCNRELDRRAAAATAMLRTEPGAALREWTDISRELTDQAALVPVANHVTWWITSDRVGNYQTGAQDAGPLLSQLWVQ